MRAHWTLPLAAFIFGQARFVPGFWIGYFLIVLIHEIGHALAVRRFRHKVISIDIHGMGGVCRWEGDARPIQRATIAWGGVNAQALALLGAAAAMMIFGPPSTDFGAQLASAFTVGNAWLIANQPDSGAPTRRGRSVETPAAPSCSTAQSSRRYRPSAFALIDRA